MVCAKYCLLANLFSVEIWVQVSGNAFISGEYSGGAWLINGTAAVFTYWNSSYPQSEDFNRCITQQLDPPYRWTNVPCSEQLPYICEVISYSKQFLWLIIVCLYVKQCIVFNENLDTVKEKYRGLIC